jgi:soluble P-type ATPase
MRTRRAVRRAVHPLSHVAFATLIDITIPGLGRLALTEAKACFAHSLGGANVAAVGNGRNDRLLLEVSALVIGICGSEGIATEALQACDIVFADAVDALGALAETNRLIATLRS